MQVPETEFSAVIRTAEGLSRRIGLLLLLACGSIVLAWFADETGFRLSLLAAGMVLILLVLWLCGLVWVGRRRGLRQDRSLELLLGQDSAACFTTDDQGRIRYRNASAAARFGDAAEKTLAAMLHEQIASPGAVLFRLQTRALANGTAREDVVTRRGHLRIAVHRIATQRFLWRLDEFQDRGIAGRGAEGLSIPMVVANRAGIVLFSNEAMRRILGERPKRLERIFGQPRFFSGEEVQVLSSEGPLRAMVVEVEGPVERREIYLLPAPPVGVNDTLETDFETVPVGLMKFLSDGGLRAANRAARDLLGDRNCADLTFHDLFDDLGRPVADWLSDVIEERLPAGSEVLRLRLAEQECFVQVQLRRFVENGRAGALAILLDATALKTLEMQFNQSQKMQAIGQLAGGIAHDFNNLLTAISGHCDLLMLRHDGGDMDHADLEQIRQNANRAAALVNQLLAFSRRQTLKPERLDLQDVLSETAHLLNRLMGEKITLRLFNDPLLGPVRADRRRLEQVVMNLAVNARDAMPDGGNIRIETEAVQLAEPTVRGKVTIPAGEYALLRVTDEGVGIPADKLNKIFEPFFTTKGVGEGTGLGLSTVYGIVKQSGGYIFVESRPDHGATFEILLPVNDAPDPVEADGVLGQPDPFRQALRKVEGVVLLVEDEAPVRAFASRALRMRGFTVIEAENAEEALKTLEDPSLVVDVFVTDVVMPGMDGPSWVKVALEARPGVRVIFVSGYAEDHLAAEQERIANSTFLPKPFSLNDLTTTVQRSLQ